MLWIDCEWNGFCGDLVSMALVDRNGREWYEVLPCRRPTPWVAANVIPVLQREPISNQAFQTSLGRFLRRYSDLQIVADWPEDISFFCNALITGPGECLAVPPPTFQVVPIESKSELSHNALADARAIRNAHLAMTHA